MTDQNDLLAKAEKRATDILQNQLPPDLSYHNYEHTKMVVDAVSTIGKGENLSEDDLETVLLAAWFHDTGFRDSYEGHEEKSIAIAEDFLKAEKIAAEKIEKVIGCIQVTQLGRRANNKLEKVLCDGDMTHIASDKYEAIADKLRVELATVKNKTYTDFEWYQQNLKFVTR